MLRTSLFLFSLLMLVGFKQEFESKQDALDYLNNSNIWIGGMPEFALDNDAGVLNITLKSNGTSATASVPLNMVKTEFISGETVSIEINCNHGELCTTAKTGNKFVNTDGLTLVMSSTFDDGNYHEKYIEHGAKIANAIDYLILFYKD
ncbi:MAG: hypothetical protein ACPGLV_08980 [Bacteroidia bacterium]